jgi:hypothetical protein
MVVLDEQQLNEYNHYVLRIDVNVQVYYNYKHVQAYHPNQTKTYICYYLIINLKLTDAVTAQFFRTTNLPARTGTSHISNVLINC